MEKLEENKVYIYIILAFVVSILVRLIWVYQFKDYSNFMWNGQFMINTNDGYFWAEGARDLLSGVHQPHDLSPVGTAASQLTFVLAKILPFSFESTIFYMPAFISSLVVIPMILIAKSLGRIEFGFIAALLASVAWSYYNRTMVGYYDTDMLNIVFPTFMLWALVLAFKSGKDKYILFAGLEIVAYRWWYPQSYSLEFAFFGLILLYTLVYDRKNIYYYKLLAMMLFAMMGLPDLIRLLAVIFVYILYKSKKIDNYMYYTLGLAFVLFLLTGGFSPIWGQLKGYVFKDSVKVVGDTLPLHFFSVMQTVREAGKIPFETFANRISGHTITFVLSLVGYILMVFRYRVMLLGLPMLGLGFLAYVGGLRFTIYAVPISAFGISYLLFFLSDYLKKFLVEGKSSRYIRTIFILLATVAILYPNIKHVVGYKVPTVFSKQEVAVLDKLKHIATREDYVVSWWDYGYPIRYYSDVKTLGDGGKHSGEVNFPISYMLTNPQLESTKLARLDVEYSEKDFRISDANLDRSEDKQVKLPSIMAQMTLDYGYKDTNDFLAALKTNIKLPKKTRNIYFYLPFRMMNIFPTVAMFSNLDLMSGNTIRRPFFYKTNRFREKNGILNLANGIYFNQKKGLLKVGKQEVPVRDFYITAYDKNKKLIKQRKVFNSNANISIIYMKSYNTFLVLDNTMLNSLYIQLFVFDNYDKNLLTPVILNPNAKVYKLRI
jgi:dolichyl-diphosphooligosaccharide--protein glycosyltransferase/undecaprenyl-diphosphooligosaccharide--protein glycosyltransferase